MKKEFPKSPMSGFIYDKQTKLNTIEMHFKKIMEALGLDLSDDSLKDTPKRVAKMYVEQIFSGLDYRNFPKIMTQDNKFKYDQMLTVRDIELNSICEHHFIPMIGKAHIAYIPNKKIIGLSKINRVAKFFAKRPQVQERLTEQIQRALSDILETEDVAVAVEAVHLCVKMRGVEDSTSSTITTALGGLFKTSTETRKEFFDTFQTR